MSEYSRTNFVTTIGTLYDDALASGATTRANQRTANGHVKDSAAWLEDFNPVTAGGTDTYTCSMLATLTSYANGRFFLVKFTNANTGASTLNVNSLGVKSIVKNGATALASGDIQAGSVKLLGYDGTNFQLVGTVASASSNITVGTTTITSGTDTRVGFNNAGVYGEDSGLTYSTGSNQLFVDGGIGIGVTSSSAKLEIKGVNNTPALYVTDDSGNAIFEAGEVANARVIGFFGGGPAIKQTSGSDLTNNVTSGGSDDVIANFTDLTTYANDAAAIRNDIYQLARKLKQINDGLRTYGIFT